MVEDLELIEAEDEDAIIDVFESFDSNKTKLTAAADGNTVNRRFFVTGTGDRDRAADELLRRIALAQFIRGGRAVVVADSLDMTIIAPKTWECTVDYVSPEKTDEKKQPKAVGEVTFSFDGTGGSINIQEAYEQQKFGPNAPDHGKAINVTDGEVAGVEIVIPQLSLSLSQRFEGATITLPWLRTVIFATGTVNEDEFLGFAPGEVLFLGPSGQQPLKFMADGTVQAGERDIEFRFAVSPNLKELEFNGIEVPEKAGHDYIWFDYEPVQDSAQKAMTKKVRGVYVARVYRRTPFANLRISNPEINFPVVG
jgi:hypothetical protein